MPSFVLLNQNTTQRTVNLIIIITQLFHQSFLMEEEMCYWQIFMDLDH